MGQSIHSVLGLNPIPTSVSRCDLLSAGIPDGFQTVSGWWATQFEQALELLDDPVSTLHQDVLALEELCAKRGIEVLHVKASPIAQRMGFTTSRLFPVTILAEYYSTGP